MRKTLVIAGVKPPTLDYSILRNLSVTHCRDNFAAARQVPDLAKRGKVFLISDNTVAAGIGSPLYSRNVKSRNAISIDIRALYSYLRSIDVPTFAITTGPIPYPCKVVHRSGYTESDICYSLVDHRAAIAKLHCFSNMISFYTREASTDTPEQEVLVFNKTLLGPVEKGYKPFLEYVADNLSEHYFLGLYTLRYQIYKDRCVILGVNANHSFTEITRELSNPFSKALLEFTRLCPVNN